MGMVLNLKLVAWLHDALRVARSRSKLRTLNLARAPPEEYEFGEVINLSG